jgi:CheY-like chemotaxis protein
VICAKPAALSNLRQACSVPLLLISRHGSFLNAEQCVDLAPLAQLASPLTREQLYQMLSKLLRPQPPQATPVSATQPGPQPASQRAPRVMLVEDNPVNQMVAKGMLHKMGCEVLLANHGGEALECLAREPIDLVLMDCNMPVMDGYEASRQIRQNPQWLHLPIIALTANAMLDERENCIAAGMNDYLAKPFRMEQLDLMVQQWLPSGRPDSATTTP